MKTINYIILHHSATQPGLDKNDTDSTEIAKVICKRARAHWQDEFPKYRCDYHFLIGKTGRIFNGQPLELPAWHATNYRVNLSSIGICFLGNFQTGVMPRVQFDAGVVLAKKLMHLFAVPIKNVLRYRDVVSDITHRANSTLCPGKNFPYISFLSHLNEVVFNDITPAYRYYKEVRFLKNHGIMLGENGNFVPQALATREELVLVADRILTHIIN